MLIDRLTSAEKLVRTARKKKVRKMNTDKRPFSTKYF